MNKTNSPSLTMAVKEIRDQLNRLRTEYDAFVRYVVGDDEDVLRSFAVLSADPPLVSLVSKPAEPIFGITVTRDGKSIIKGDPAVIYVDNIVRLIKGGGTQLVRITEVGRSMPSANGREPYCSATAWEPVDGEVDEPSQEVSAEPSDEPDDDDRKDGKPTDEVNALELVSKTEPVTGTWTKLKDGWAVKVPANTVSAGDKVVAIRRDGIREEMTVGTISKAFLKDATGEWQFVYQQATDAEKGDDFVPYAELPDGSPELQERLILVTPLGEMADAVRERNLAGNPTLRRMWDDYVGTGHVVRS
jgi:hypothetical protein